MHTVSKQMFTFLFEYAHFFHLPSFYRVPYKSIVETVRICMCEKPLQKRKGCETMEEETEEKREKNPKKKKKDFINDYCNDSPG